MTIIIRGLALLALFASVLVFAQERQHNQHQAQKEAAPAKPATTKCCDGMDKVGEMTGSMPMKAETTDDMKAKMAKMKEKMAGKMSEKAMKMQTNESKVEKDQSSKDGHQH